MICCYSRLLFYSSSQLDLFEGGWTGDHASIAIPLIAIAIGNCTTSYAAPVSVVRGVCADGTFKFKYFPLESRHSCPLLLQQWRS
mmetsp:Transcript_13755/g.20345  ORF Transcript_13755/g.20345 Transcript_13755/m.20345 type:complete len:85 (+) Transcript_13755:1231-1485(+)